MSDFTEASKTEKTISTFSGYNHNLRTSDGEFYDMQNMTSSYYPMLATRHKRATIISKEKSKNLNSLFSKDKLLYVLNDDDGKPTVYYDNEVVKDGEGNAFTLSSDCLANESDYLTIKTTLSTPGTTIAVNEAISSDEAIALAGRKVIISSGNQYTIASAAAGSAGAATITLTSNVSTEQGIAGNIIYPNDHTEKQLVSMGAYVLIFPDKKYLNTADTTDFGDMGAKFTSTGIVTYSLCQTDGTDYTDYTSSDTAPTSPSDGDLWMDTSTTPNVLKQYSTNLSVWNSISTTYVKISNTGIGKNFKQYDGVKISGAGVTIPTFERKSWYSSIKIIETVMQSVFDKSRTIDYDQFNTTMIIWAVSDDWIVVSGLINGTVAQADVLTVEREIPDMEYLCEGENRIWGCNSENNEIYACKLGDFKNWNCFMGLSTDSYAVSVGSDGDFTGAIRYNSSVLFFKEEYIHKIYNTNPPYNVSSVHTKGVQNGSNKSLSIVNGVLFYLSSSGVRTYEGSLSTPISEELDDTFYHNGIAGEFRDKYYICMSDSVARVTGSKTVIIGGLPFIIPVIETSGGNHLFVYDTRKGMWHKEDDIDILQFAKVDGNLFFINSYSDSDGEHKDLTIANSETIYTKDDDGNSIYINSFLYEQYFDWFAETGLIGLEYVGNKYIKTVSLRLKLDTIDKDTPAFVKLYAEYDSCGEWELLDELKAQETKAYTIKARIPRRCDHMRLRIVGRGQCYIYSITYQTEEGTEL